MAMTGPGMAAAVIAALVAEFGSEYENLPDDEKLTGYDQATYWNRYWTAVGTAIVTYIQGQAKAVGTDTPSGDNHNLSIT